MKRDALGSAQMIARDLFAPVPWSGFRATPRRRFNLLVNRIEHLRRRTRLWSNPFKLIVEPINACNLRCPYCFTGAGGKGRARSTMPMPLYRRLLDELGATLLELELFNWGEPLLNPDIHSMIALAHARGVSTTLNTNFSLPFDTHDAERLVASGLTVLTVSIDGARQETYEQYRVRGDYRTVLRNCRAVAAAKTRLGSTTPHLNWEFHVFPHNEDDYEQVRSQAAELGMRLLTFRGTVPGVAWTSAKQWDYCGKPVAFPCASLWAIGVVNNDGGVAPCNGTFYREDDFGLLAATPGAPGAPRFRDVWNGPAFRTARRLFSTRTGAADERKLICSDCPTTVTYERWRAHVAEGGTADSFHIAHTTNEAWNYFWNRRPPRPGVHVTPVASASVSANGGPRHAA